MSSFIKDFRSFKDDSGLDVREELLPDREADFPQPRTRWRRPLPCFYIFLFTVSLSCLLFLVGILVGNRWLSQHINSVCIERTAQKSPITRDLDIAYHDVRFNGSLLKENVFRHPAGKEVDAAWASLGVHYRSVIVPPDQARRVGLAADQVKVNQEYGGGYPANVEGLHQLHCLNLVRQALYYNYHYYQDKGEGAFKNTDYILRKHVCTFPLRQGALLDVNILAGADMSCPAHCLDIIRQQLMCTVDIGVLGQVWFQPASAEYPEAYVDFNTKHVCRDFDAVRRWAEERQIPEQIPEDFLEPPREGDRIYSKIP